MAFIEIQKGAGGPKLKTHKDNDDNHHLYMINSPVTQQHNRTILTLAATPKACVWTAGDNITELNCLFVPDGGTAGATEIIGVVFDAPSAATAALWLTEAESLTTDTPIAYIKINEPTKFQFYTALTNAYFVRIAGAATYRGAIGAN